MKFIYASAITKSNGLIYLAFDTDTQSIYNVDYRNIVDNLSDYYGIQIDSGKLKFIGYNNLPKIDKNLQYAGQSYTLVGVIKGNPDEYVLVKPIQSIVKVTRDKVLKLASSGAITNIAVSDKVIRLRIGKLPIIRKQKNRDRIKDTVIKIIDADGLYEDMQTVGVGPKFFGKRLSDGKFGMVKKQVQPNRYDNINEILCFYLGKLFGVNVCEASQVIYDGENDWVIQIYQYEYGSNQVIQCKNAFGIDNFNKQFNIKAIRNRFGDVAVDDFNRMIIFDTITRQTDRHIRNFQFYKDRMYPLYDNGRCLFWDKQRLSEISNIDLISQFYTNEHGYGWNYLDGNLGPMKCRRLINQKVTYNQVLQVVSKFYTFERAEILQKYIYRAYRLVIGGRIDV